MIERGGGLGFLHEAALAFRVGDPLGRQDLDGDEAVQVGVTGFVDHAHPAFAELLCDLVMPQRLADHEDLLLQPDRLDVGQQVP